MKSTDLNSVAHHKTGSDAKNINYLKVYNDAPTLTWDQRKHLRKIIKFIKTSKELFDDFEMAIFQRNISKKS